MSTLTGLIYQSICDEFNVDLNEPICVHNASKKCVLVFKIEMLVFSFPID